MISAPFLQDPFFKRSVIILTESSIKMGAMGFILNRPLDFKLSDLMDEFPNSDNRIYLGGPVEKDSLFYMHTIDNMCESDVEITKGMYWGTDFSALKLLIETENVDIKKIRFFLGYAGWDIDQLEKEMKEESWFVSKAKKEHLLDENYKEMWKSTVIEMGKEFTQMANFPEDPSLN
ncbi:MAG: YqgE/AlgH family protein [Flavobacteriales bacterium]|nr:YqgE/AlgH family protein [Flavobacteriales bacterium]